MFRDSLLLMSSACLDKQLRHIIIACQGDLEKKKKKISKIGRADDFVFCFM